MCSLSELPRHERVLSYGDDEVPSYELLPTLIETSTPTHSHFISPFQEVFPCLEEPQYASRLTPPQAGLAFSHPSTLCCVLSWAGYEGRPTNGIVFFRKSFILFFHLTLRTSYKDSPLVLAVMLKMFFAMQLEKDRVFAFSWGGVLVPSSRGTFLIEELQEFLL